MAEILEPPAEKQDVYESLLGLASNRRVVEEEDEGSEEGQELDEGVEDSEEKEGIEQEGVEISEDDQGRIDSLIQEAESRSLTDDEIKFLTDNGYDVKPGEEEEEDDGTWYPPAYIDSLQQLSNRALNSRDEVDEAVAMQLQIINNLNNMVNLAYQNNPELKPVLEDVIQGKMSFSAALAAHLDIKDLIPDKDTPEYDSYVERKILMKQEQAEAARRQQMLVENQRRGAEVVRGFLSSKGMDENRSRAFLHKTNNLIQNFNNGNVTEEFLETMFKGLEYDTAVATAEKRGEVKGKNAIIIKKRKGITPTMVVSRGKGNLAGKVKKSLAEDQSVPLFDKLKGLASNGRKG